MENNNINATEEKIWWTNSPRSIEHSRKITDFLGTGRPHGK